MTQSLLFFILTCLFFVVTTSTKFSPWHQENQDYDVVFNDGDRIESIPKESLEYGHPLMGSAWKDTDDDYEYYWSFVPEPQNENPLNFPAKEKKGGHLDTTLCMNVPKHKKYNEEIGFDFKPSAFWEYNCEAIPPQVFENWDHLKDSVTVCKVRGNCHTHEREIRVFKKKRNSNRNEGNCWQKENFNVSVGCLCLNHIYHEI